MSVEIKIDFKGITKQINQNIRDGVDEVLLFLKDYAMKTSPIDTGEYNKNHTIVKAQEIGRYISGVLYNDTYYAPYLEYGVGGKSYNYHRYGKVFMSGVGARVYTRTQDDNLNNIVAIIKKNLFKKS